MKIRNIISAGVIVCAMVSTAESQTRSAELDLTAGYSGEEIRGAAAQARVFGELDDRSRIRYFAEAAWGRRWAGEEEVTGGTLIGADPMGTDVFGAAYPYSNKIDITEIYAERLFTPGHLLFGVRGGQFRTPFGIYNRSDYAYGGFIRPPLLRYDGYFGLSNNYFERGAMFTAGIPQLSVDATISKPHDVGSSRRRDGVDESVRVQGYHGAFIVGVSHARSEPYLPSTFAKGRQVFTGTDVRWSHSSGIQLRGEFFHGHSFDGVTTNGWYVDAMVHHLGMGPVTAVARSEAMDYTAPEPRARSAHRLTVGARVRLPRSVTLQSNFMHQRGDLPRIYNNSLDFTITYSLRYR